MSKLGICKQAAITTSGHIPNSIIAYGLYIPKHPLEEWHEHWQRPAQYPVFTHFWVETPEGIIDTGAEQFGESDKVETQKTDPHYVKVGIYDKFEDKTIPVVQNPVIKWETLTGEGGIVNVVWEGIDSYLEKLESL